MFFLTKLLTWLESHAGLAAWLQAAGIIAALFAIPLSILQLQDTRNQMLLSMVPSINIVTENDPDDPPVGISIHNGGPGIASIRSVTYYIDNKPFNNVEDVLKEAHLDGGYVQFFVFENGDSLGVGEKQWFFKFEDNQKIHIHERNRFAEFIDHNLGIEIKFCPIVGICVEKCSKQNACKR